jgi:hypothetical protein
MQHHADSLGQRVCHYVIATEHSEQHILAVCQLLPLLRLLLFGIIHPSIPTGPGRPTAADRQIRSCTDTDSRRFFWGPTHL